MFVTELKAEYTEVNPYRSIVCHSLLMFMLANHEWRVKSHAEIVSCRELRDACQIWFIIGYQSNDSNLSSQFVIFAWIFKDGAFEHFSLFKISKNSLGEIKFENESNVSLFLDKKPKILREINQKWILSYETKYFIMADQCDSRETQNEKNVQMRQYKIFDRKWNTLWLYSYKN